MRRAARDFLKMILHEQGAKARALRATFFTLVLAQGEQVLRLAGSLVLTRLLMPEAFGLMAIVTVFVVGFKMLTDVGIHTSVIQNERGDDPDFLDTAWTLQVIRGVLLWALVCLASIPAARIYGEPMLLQLMPVVALSLIVQGFNTTNVMTANRHLVLGRIAAQTLVVQAVGLAITAALAWATGSVWALAIGTVTTSAILVAVNTAFLPGIRNRLRLEPEAAWNMIHFGKYLFASSLAAFAVMQADKMILGAYLPLALFGVYSIGWTLASIANATSDQVNKKVLAPLYRMRHPLDGEGNRRAIFRARRLVVGCSLAINAGVGFAGVWLVELLFDPRYALAGATVVVMTMTRVPKIVVTGMLSAGLARGDSRSFSIVTVSTAVLQTVLILVGLTQFGILGAVGAIGLTMVLLYPFHVRVARRYANWDPVTDALAFAAGMALNGAACWVHREEIAALAAAAAGG